MPDRNKRGQYTEEISLDDVIDVFQATDLPAVNARYIADELGCTRQAADQKLRKLAADGRVERGKLSPRTVIWWLADEP